MSPGGSCRQNSFLSQDLWSGHQAGSQRPDVCGKRDRSSRYRTYWPIMPRRRPGAHGAEAFSIILLPPVSWFWWAIVPRVCWLRISRPSYPHAASSSWTARSPHRKEQPHPSGPRFAISSEVLRKPTDLFRFGQNGSPAMRNVRLSLASISWPAIPWPSRSSRMDFRKCRSVGSTIRSSSQAGIISLPASSRLQGSMTMQPQKRSAAAGR
jgi:hypothetical protein